MSYVRKETFGIFVDKDMNIHPVTWN